MELSQNHKIFAYILIAYIFGVLMRMFWIWEFSSYDQFIHNSVLMINTNDGYYFAEGARDALNGFAHQKNDLSPILSPLSLLSAAIVKITPFSIEQVLLYMPAVFGSLIVVPIVLIGRELGDEFAGFLAALLSVIAHSYYNRTMAGYYDTDMLTIVAPLFILYFLIRAVLRGEKNILYFTFASFAFHNWWYPNNYALNVAFCAMIFLYAIAFDRKNKYLYKLLIFAIAGSILWLSAKMVLFGTLLYLNEKKSDFFEKKLFWFFGATLAVLMIFGGFLPIWGQFKNYVFKDEVLQAGLHYFTVMQTIREAGAIPLEMVAQRISGSTITFVVSFVGFIFLAFRQKVFLIALPMAAIGALAHKSGLRFTIFTVAPFALGLGFLVVYIFDTIFKSAIFTSLKNQEIKTFLTKMFAFAVFIFALFPNILHIQGYQVPTVLNKDEVAALESLKTVADPQDYVISWWDYGYPIRYYADVKTMGDGGKHEGDTNFPLSFVLTKPQNEAYKMAKFAVEYNEKGYDDELAKKNYAQNGRNLSYIEMMMNDYGYSDVNIFLGDIKNLPPPQKTTDTYLYLPFRMLDIFPTVKIFSDIDLSTGKVDKKEFFYKTSVFQDLGENIDLGSGVVLSKKGQIKISNNKVNINSFTIIGYDEKQKLVKQTQNIDPSSPIFVIFMKNYNTFLVMEKSYFNSLFVKLFVLEEYDSTLFEPIVVNPFAKIYKLK